MAVPPISLTGGAASGGNQKTSYGGMNGSTINTGGGSFSVLMIGVVVVAVGGVVWVLKKK